MKFGVPWNVKGVRPEVRDSARQAARRNGMSVGEWLNHVIAERSTSDDPDAHDPLDEYDSERERLTERIDRLDQRLGQILGTPLPPARETIYQADPRAFAPPPYAPPGYAPAPPPAGPWASSIEQAVAEISARQHSLDAPLVPQPAYAPPMPAPSYAAPYYSPAASAPPTPPVPRFPVQDLSGLENQLRHITEQIERLHQPKDSEEIAALRKELAEIGNKLNEAMPQRAIEALEHEMRNIAARIDQSRQSGIDPAIISGMERGLVDVHTALRELKPAESFTGFEDAIRGLSHKIEKMAGAGDPAFLQQLEAAITALRGIVSHVASNDQLAMLADEMRGLSAKIERVAGNAGTASPDNMVALEQKIGALTEQLKNTTGGGALPPRIESLLNSFSDRMDRGELSSGDQFALGTLEDRIVNLSAKLDASDARLNQLGAIERGMAELLVHIEDLRGGGLSATPRNDMPRNDIKREIAKTQDSLEAVHGTVGAVVDRLAILETAGRDLEIAQSAPAAPRVMPQLSESHSLASSEPKSVPASAAPIVRAGPPANQPRRPIDPNLPPDYPLEPGSGVPRERGVSAADRIAASEAALGGVNPGSASSGSTNFIAAARRAAQAATPADAPAAKQESAKPGHKSLGQRVRSMLAGASVILLVAGGLKLSMDLLQPVDQTAELPLASAAQIASHSEAIAAAAKQRTARAPDGFAPAPSLNPFQPGTAPDPDQEPHSDVTASIGQPAPQAMPLPPATEQPLPATATDQRLTPPEKLPAVLRNAAASGDPSAAYEIAMRHLEGRGISQSLDEAARWLERAAKSGLAPAQFRLGSLYEKGQGVKKNIDTAQRLYQAAAQKGNAKAMHNLAVLHAEGAQGKPDYKAASQWFRKAADRGVADSQYNLGILYARGVGVEQNLAEAYKWFSLAGAQGDKEAVKKRDEVGTRLDAQSLMAARLAAQTFTAEPQPDEASVVKTPEGGWDRATAAPKPAKKPRAIEPLRITPS